jgi:hypothetical protein
VEEAVITIKPASAKPEEVFTPRGEFNSRMYTRRSSLEEDFKEKLRRKVHIVIYGESGCGKTWLYKNFFSENAVKFKVVNLADASRNGKISTELLRVVRGEAKPELTGYDEKLTAEVSAVVAKGALDHTKKYEIAPPDPLRSAVQEFRRQSGSGHAFIVLDNLERIFEKPALMDELADLITLADDGEFLQEKVRFLLVGVPSGVKEYFANTPSHRTVANRLIEVKEVSRLSLEEAEHLVTHGFEIELNYKVDKQFKPSLLKHALWISDRIPQALQEYCLELAFIAESSRQITAEMLDEADKKWLQSSLTAAYTAVEGHLNERETKVQRRNQVLYVLGQLDVGEFKAQHVEEAVKKSFYVNSPDAAVGGVPNALTEISDSKSQKQILKRTPKGDAYMFVDPQYRMAIRAMLRLDANGMVEKVPMENL